MSIGTAVEIDMRDEKNTTEPHVTAQTRDVGPSMP